MHCHILSVDSRIIHIYSDTERCLFKRGIHDTAFFPPSASPPNSRHILIPVHQNRKSMIIEIQSFQRLQQGIGIYIAAHISVPVTHHFQNISFGIQGYASPYGFCGISVQAALLYQLPDSRLHLRMASFFQA